MPEPRSGWPAMRWPEGNPYSAAKAILGRRLFFENALSRDGSLSCGSCHKAGGAFADPQRVSSTGIDGHQTPRNTPTLANLVFAASFMLDGRIATLEEQALAPLFAPGEMDMNREAVETALSADTMYLRLFRQAYGDGPVTLEGVTRALATYQRTLVSGRSPYDRWADGDADALSPAARRGRELFSGGETSCSQCHTPPLFTDGLFHNTGLDPVYADSGRARVTGLGTDLGKFRTPSLRNVAVTWPYMHDGRFETLAEVVAHYNSGGKPHPNADPRLHALDLSPDEEADLVAFLESLTDSAFLAQSRP